MKVNDRLNVGASLDYTWASLDMKLLASPQQFDQMFQFSNGGMTLAQADAYLGTSMNGNFARLDFPNPTNYGSSQRFRLDGKAGCDVQSCGRLTFGASYQMKHTTV